MSAAVSAALRLVLLAWVLAPGLGSPLAATLDEEVGIIQALRQSMNDADPWQAQQFGWAPDVLAAHCEWHQVTCDANGYVQALALGWGMPIKSAFKSTAGGWDSSAPVPTGAMLPALARLSRLKELAVLPSSPHVPVARPLAAIPREWVQPGALPSLEQLLITTVSMAAPLPDIQPGALPRLFRLHIDAAALRTPLPASWGAPGVLPSLSELHVCAQIEGPLPPEWAHGFSQLDSLKLEAGHMSQVAPFLLLPADWAALAQQPPPALALPPEWADGFPSLTILALRGLGTSQTLPREWAEGGFPLLEALAIDGCPLTGTLPDLLLASHPHLRRLFLRDANLIGPLPDAWADAQALAQIELQGNALTGPAIPPAWLAADAFWSLELLDLSSNPGLGGTLPDDLPWPVINRINVSGTGVHGSVPESWCTTLLARPQAQLSINHTAVSANVSCPLSNSIEAAPSEQQEQQHEVPQVGAASVAAAIAGLAACGSGWLLWRLRQRRQRRGRQRDEGLALLPLTLRHLGDSATNSISSTNEQRGSSSGPAESSSSGTNSWQQRVGALLSTRRGKIQLLPLDALGKALAHELAQQPQRGGGAPQASAAGGVSRAASTLQREWRLATESLRVTPSELEFIADPDGGLTVLGTGSHAVVYLARLNGQHVAVKVFELGAGLDSTAMWHEVALLRNCRHPRVVQLLGVAVEGDLLLLAMELLGQGTLRAALRDPAMREELRWEARGRQVALDVAEAMVYLHTQLRMLHSDLKAANVLLSAGWRAKVSDLGMAQVLAGSARLAVGFSRVYAAPEQLMGQRCTLAADMYSLGVLLVFLTTRRHTEQRGEWRVPTAPDDCPQDVVALIQACMAPDPQDRPTAAEALQRLTDA